MEFWANEVEVEKFHNKIADLNGEGARLSTELVEMQRIQAETASALARKAEELDEVIADREIVTRQRRALTVKHAEAVSALAGLREEHAEAVSALAGLREEACGGRKRSRTDASRIQADYAKVARKSLIVNPDSKFARMESFIALLQTAQ